MRRPFSSFVVASEFKLHQISFDAATALVSWDWHEHDRHGSRKASSRKERFEPRGGTARRGQV